MGIQYLCQIYPDAGSVADLPDWELEFWGNSSALLELFASAAQVIRAAIYLKQPDAFQLASVRLHFSQIKCWKT